MRRSALVRRTGQCDLACARRVGGKGLSTGSRRDPMREIILTLRGLLSDLTDLRNLLPTTRRGKMTTTEFKAIDGLTGPELVRYYNELVAEAVSLGSGGWKPTQK